MFDEIFIIDVCVHVANGWFSFRYAEFFLKPKRPRPTSMLIWIFAYTTGQLICQNIIDSQTVYDNFNHLLPYILLFGILSFIFFEKNLSRMTFALASFIAGWEILRFTASPLAHAILGLWNPLWERGINALLDSGFMQAETLLIVIQYANRIALFVTLLICRVIQFGAFYIYLKLIRKNFVADDYTLTSKETCFLLIPCITSLTVDVTLRVMAYSADNGALTLIYDRAPETLLLLPAVSVLLLGFTISSVILFKGLTDGKIEERKRLLLENRVEEVRERVKEIESIYGDMRGLKHDLRGAIANIAACVTENADKSDEIDSYLKGMEKIVARLDFIDHTGSSIVDAILSRFRAICKERKITVDFNFYYPKNSCFDIYDLGIVLNNALQNAVEATEKVDDNSCVSLRSYEKGALFFMEVENDFEGSLIWEKNSDIPSTVKEDKNLHGIGLMNIRRIAEKYNGDMDISVEKGTRNNLFLLTVMLYNKSNQGE